MTFEDVLVLFLAGGLIAALAEARHDAERIAIYKAIIHGKQAIIDRRDAQIRAMGGVVDYD